MDNMNPIDPWAAPATKVAAFIGVFWVSYKILSFWRMIASLFILPGQSVCLQSKRLLQKSSTNP
jgi:17beta-estradiol 17-dehydrogenase / very-long-chain 3-oxoacyl-CoA reductase